VQSPPRPEVPALLQAVAFHRDPLGVLRRARARHGPVFALRMPAVGPVVVVAERNAVGPLLEADPQAARAGEARRRVLPVASAASSFGADGERHRAARARIERAFGADALAGRAEAMARIAERHAERWPRRRPFRLLARVRTLIDEVFVRLVLGVADEARAVALVDALRRMLATPGNPPLPVPGPGNDTLAGPARALVAWRSAPLARLLAAAIDDRRRRAGPGDDVIGAMLASAPELPTAEMVDELLAVLMAAQEPPSVALGWLLDRAGRDEAAREALLDPQGGRGSARVRVVRETLRLRPPALAALRRLTAPMRVDGRGLAPGTTTMLPIPLLQRDPGGFPDPDRFRPDRWSGGEADVAAYLPFGGGARRCLGEPLAQTYFQAVLPAILRSVSLRPLYPQPERMVVRATTLVPIRSCLVTASGGA
jgi:cytochrome P450